MSENTRKTPKKAQKAPKMQKTPNLRWISLDLVMQIMENGAFCDKALHRAFEQYALDSRDKSFVMWLVEGTVESCIRLDYTINQYAKTPVSKMKPAIRAILRISVYQLLYMDQVPDAAACNEAVRLAEKKKLFGLKGFVNGVLRTIARKKDRLVLPDKTSFLSYASVRYSAPEWLVERLVRQYGKERTESILASFLTEEKKTLSVRCTLSRFDIDAIKESLQKQGVLVRSGEFFADALLLQQYAPLAGLEAFQRGMFQVQDESSMVVGAVSGICPGDVVLDVCAAPGGKSMHAAELLAGSGTLYSLDLTRQKTDLIRQNVRRLGYQNIIIEEQDAARLREEWIETADVVIADLPCSGLGVIRKKCDIKYKTKPEDIVALAALQRQILGVVSQYVKKGGRLIFSTCTIAAEENEENVRWIEQNLPFWRVDIESNLPQQLQGRTGREGYCQILPDEAGADGFFVSCFQKKK